ncbi:MAG: hypothetical protein GF405_03075 [Candidatus Eisenbacteria bacterium]|nr:hypothetical protein [Candidatus Eisenbacteria bacterium]
MSDWTSIRERYLRDGVPVRLGGLAANLARIRSFSDQPEHEEVVGRMVRESAMFIEWTAQDIPSDDVAALAELQRDLVRWYQHWHSLWADPERRAEVARDAAQWSTRVLEISGLMSREA